MKNGINFDEYEHELVYRGLALAPDERFGLGLMFKTGNKFEYDNSIHPRFALIIILRGEGTLYDESGQKFNLKAGMCFKRVPGKAETLSIKDNSRWTEFFIEIGPALYQALRSMRIVDAKPLCENIEIDIDFFNKLMRLKEQFKNIDERALPYMVGDFAKILTECQQRCSCYGENKENELVDTACNFLSSDFSNECDIKVFLS